MNPYQFSLARKKKTGSTMSSLFLALVLYSQVQRQAQAQLDVATRRHRLPTFDDRPRLPYINVADGGTRGYDSEYL